jgi:hypothetical protein
MTGYAQLTAIAAGQEMPIESTIRECRIDNPIGNLVRDWRAACRHADPVPRRRDNGQISAFRQDHARLHWYHGPEHDAQASTLGSSRHPTPPDATP